MILLEYTAPTALLLAVLLMVGGAVAFSCWRHLSWSTANVLMGVTYVAAMVLLIWCMLLPGHKEDLTRLLRPKFAVVLDTSESMTLRPRDDVSNRWETAQQVLALPWVSTIASECDVELFSLAGELGDPAPVSEAASMVPSGSATHLRDGLNELAGRFSGLNVAGVLLISDGLETREAFNDWAADERAFPVYSVRLEEPGQWQEEVEVRVENMSTPRRVSIGWQSECSVLISGQGTRGNAVVVQLFKDGTLVDEQPTQLATGGGEQEVVFNLEHPAIGVFHYHAVIPPLPGEINTNDNDFAVSVQVTDAKNRLLYVEGAPRWEYKFMRRALMGQEEITPVIFYTGPDGAPRQGSEHKGITADMTPSQLAYFKIVILGNLSAEELGTERVANLIKFVDDGGSLVVLGGSRGWGEGGMTDTELLKILPVRGRTGEALTGENPFPLSLTDAARTHPAFAGDPELWSQVPPIPSVFPGPTLSPTAQALVLADTPQGKLPVVVTHRYGQGKVAVLLTDSLWKWQLSPDADENNPYARFWVQMISWLLPDEEEGSENTIQLFADVAQLHLGEEIQITARVAGEEELGSARIRAAMTFPDQRTVDFDMKAQWVSTASGKSFPGHHLAYTVLEPGLYTVVAQSDDSGVPRMSGPLSFYVKPYSPESVPRPIDEGLLRTLAETSGGTYFESLSDLDLALSELRPQAIEEASAEFKTLWRTWPIMLVIMALVTASWVNRKVRGMP